MTSRQVENIDTRMARLEERMSSDRKATSIYNQHFNEEVQEMKLMLRQNSADISTYIETSMQILNEVRNIQKEREKNIEEFRDKEKKIREDLDHTKKTLKVFIWLGKNTKTMIAIATIIIIGFIEKIPDMWKYMLKSFGIN